MERQCWDPTKQVVLGPLLPSLQLCTACKRCVGFLLIECFTLLKSDTKDLAHKWSALLEGD